MHALQWDKKKPQQFQHQYNMICIYYCQLYVIITVVFSLYFITKLIKSTVFHLNLFFFLDHITFIIFKSIFYYFKFINCT